MWMLWINGKPIDKNPVWNCDKKSLKELWDSLRWKTLDKVDLLTYQLNQFQADRMNIQHKLKTGVFKEEDREYWEMELERSSLLELKAIEKFNSEC